MFKKSCKFCDKQIEISGYIAHVCNGCAALSKQEKKRASDAIKNLLCQCYFCQSLIRVDGYEKHAKKCHPAPEVMVWNISHPGELMCFCPCHPQKNQVASLEFGVSIRFADYKQHVLQACPDFINFIAAHCRPANDFPTAEMERLKNWIQQQQLRTQEPQTTSLKKREPSIVIAEKKSQSVYKLMQGGLCNSD